MVSERIFGAVAAGVATNDVAAPAAADRDETQCRGV